ncbi:MAG: hypothetical protein FJZ90_00990 [Chloroflexi bacterium]|nr:hypothetical protein [Chloroflexota bacterium]
MHVLLPALVAATLCGGVLFLALRKRAALVRTLARYLALALAVLSFLLLAHPGEDRAVRFTWAPLMDSVGLSTAAPGIYLAIMAFWTLYLGCRLREERPPPSALELYWPGWAYVLCSVVVLALTVDHFVARIVLLDLLSLSLMPLLLIDLSAVDYHVPIIRRYLIFRVGDSAFMLLAMLLHQHSATFHIDSALASAADLPAGPFVTVVLSGVLAAWVKLGLPPCHGWVAEGAMLPRSRRIWVLGAALPLLGAYLLYRLGPLAAGRPAAFLVIGVGLLLMLWGVHRGLRSPNGSSEAQTGWLVAHSALGLALMPTPAMRLFLLTFLPVRVGLCLGLASTVLLAPARAMRRLPVSESGLFGSVLRWLGASETSLFEGIPHRVAQAVVALADLTAQRLERGVFDRSVQSVPRIVDSIAGSLQLQHTGQLRRNLLWVSVALVAIVALMLLWEIK